jgi:hypothetical protein
MALQLMKAAGSLVQSLDPEVLLSNPNADIEVS